MKTSFLIKSFQPFQLKMLLCLLVLLFIPKIIPPYCSYGETKVSEYIKDKIFNTKTTYISSTILEVAIKMNYSNTCLSYTYVTCSNVQCTSPQLTIVLVVVIYTHSYLTETLVTHLILNVLNNSFSFFIVNINNRLWSGFKYCWYKDSFVAVPVWYIQSHINSKNMTMILNS